MQNSNELNLSIESLPGALLTCRQDGIICQSNNQALTYSNESKNDFCEINISQLISEMGHLLKNSFPTNLEINYDLMKSIPSMNANPSHIRHLILKMIADAKLINQKHSTINISTGVINVKENSCFETFTDNSLPQGEYVFIKVSNKDLTQEDKQADNTENSISEKSFSSTMEILANHHGARKVESDKDNGLALTVLLPCALVEEEVLDLNDGDEVNDHSFREEDFNDDFLFADKEYFSNDDDFMDEDDCFGPSDDSMNLIQDYFDRPGY